MKVPWLKRTDILQICPQSPLPISNLPQLFAFLGFLTSALWINAAATEVVNILRSLGVVFRLSNTVLGLTLLAWGNSIGGDSGPGGFRE